MDTKGHCYPKHIILQALDFKLRFALSYRDIEEMMKIRGVIVDYGVIQHRVYKFHLSVKLFLAALPLFVPIFCTKPWHKRISLHTSEANWRSNRCWGCRGARLL